jgi:hypothetical protein
MAENIQEFNLFTVEAVVRLSKNYEIIFLTKIQIMI